MHIFHSIQIWQFGIYFWKSVANQRRSDLFDFRVDISKLIVDFPHFPSDSKWESHGETVAGSDSSGNGTHQFKNPLGLDIDNDNHTMFIADRLNNRVMRWKMGDPNGEVVAGDHSGRSRSHTLTHAIRLTRHFKFLSYVYFAWVSEIN